MVGVLKRLSIFAAENDTFALVAKLVDAPDLGSGVVIRVGSSPIRRTLSESERGNFLFHLFIYVGLSDAWCVHTVWLLMIVTITAMIIAYSKPDVPVIIYK